MREEARSVARPTFAGWHVEREPALELQLGGEHATTLRTFSGRAVELPDGDTHYVHVLRGHCALESAGGSFRLTGGMYAALAAAGRIRGDAAGIVVSRRGYRGMFQLGGPIEERGRLRYIDGCTDSLLLGPVVRGDPCLNHLHIPAGTRQTRHTHPSLRVGVIARGAGRCVTPEGEHPLEAGLCFVIEPDGPHSFHTGASALDVVVYHPDSDTGPTHEDHPMKNRTLFQSQKPGAAR